MFFRGRADVKAGIFLLDDEWNSCKNKKLLLLISKNDNLFPTTALVLFKAGLNMQCKLWLIAENRKYASEDDPPLYAYMDAAT